MAFLAGLILPVLIFMLGAKPSVEGGTAGVSEDSPETVKLATGTIPVLASGVVKAADSTIIYAKTPGEVKDLLVREGGVVKAGQVMLRQSSPVTTARLELVKQEAALTKLQQTLNQEVNTLKTDKATVAAEKAANTALLRAVSDDKQVSEASDALLANLDTAVTTAVSAIDYVNNHRSLFSAAGLARYDEVVSDLYGRIPNRFSSGLAKPAAEKTSLVQLLEKAKTDNNPAYLETLALLTQAQLEGLVDLFKTAEEDVFDRQETLITDNDRNEYLTMRTNTLSALQTLISGRINFSQVTDGVLQDKVNQKSGVEISEVDRNLAALQEKYGNLIASQTKRVSEAQIGVVRAELSLLEPAAPFSGVVTEVLVDKGQYVTPGTPLFKLVGQGGRELELNVPSYLLGGVKLGQPYRYQNRVIGHVSRFSRISESGSGTVVVTLNPDNKLPVGTAISGELEVKSGEDVYKVPRAFVHFDSDGIYLKYEDKTVTGGLVVYDAGEHLYLTVDQYKDKPLLPAAGVNI